VSGLGHTALHIKVEDRLRLGSFLGHPPPARTSRTHGTIPVVAVSDAIDIHMVVVGRPVVLEVIEELRPIWLEAMDFEVAQRKGKPVVDADERGRAVAKFSREPFGQSPPRPILPRARRRQHLGGRLRRRRRVEAQSLQAAFGSLRARIVDAEVTFKLGHGESGSGEFGNKGGEEVGGGGGGA